MQIRSENVVRGPSSSASVTGVRASATALTQSPTASGSSSSKKIIYLSYFSPTAQFLNTNRAYIDTLPLDGVCFYLSGSLQSAIMRNVAVSQATIANELALLGTGTWTKVIDKWVTVYASPVGAAANSFSVDADWTIASSNFTNLAAAVAAKVSSHHLAGIFFDTETYFGQVWQGPDTDWNAAYARGKQIMQAIIAGWPSAKVLCTHFTWASDSRTAGVYNAAGAAYDSLSDYYNTIGSFTSGMVAATTGTSATIIDGGEMYTARTSSAYQAIYDWNKSGVAGAGTGCVVPVGDRAAYPGTVRIGFGVYDQPWNGATMDENIWKATLQLAINRSDEVVWAYTERFDWLGVNSAPNVPTIWKTLTSQVVR